MISDGNVFRFSRKIVEMYLKYDDRDLFNSLVRYMKRKIFLTQPK